MASDKTVAGRFAQTACDFLEHAVYLTREECVDA